MGTFCKNQLHTPTRKKKKNASKQTRRAARDHTETKYRALLSCSLRCVSTFSNRRSRREKSRACTEQGLLPSSQRKKQATTGFNFSEVAHMRSSTNIPRQKKNTPTYLYTLRGTGNCDRRGERGGREGKGVGGGAPHPQ